MIGLHGMADFKISAWLRARGRMPSIPCHGPWIVMLIISITIQAAAGQPSPSSPATACIEAIQGVERTARLSGNPLPGWVLGAVVRTESGFDPLALNVSGHSLHPVSRLEAFDIARTAVGEHRFVDVGCAQINVQFHGKAFDDNLQMMLDPMQNVAYAARLLRQLAMRERGNWARAIGLYHSRSPALRALYLCQVRRNLALSHGSGGTKIDCVREERAARQYQVSKPMGHTRLPQKDTSADSLTTKPPSLDRDARTRAFLDQF